MIDPAWINAGASIVGKALAAPAAAPTVSTATNTGAPTTLNADGWAVSFGGGSASGGSAWKTTENTSNAATAPFDLGAMMGGAAVPKTQAGSWLLGAILLGVGVVAWRKHRRG